MTKVVFNEEMRPHPLLAVDGARMFLPPLCVCVRKPDGSEDKEATRIKRGNARPSALSPNQRGQHSVCTHVAFFVSQPLAFPAGLQGPHQCTHPCPSTESPVCPHRPHGASLRLSTTVPQPCVPNKPGIHNPQPYFIQSHCLSCRWSNRVQQEPGRYLCVGVCIFNSVCILTL